MNETEATVILKPDSPEIKPNQSWIVKYEDKILKRIRILAVHPDGGWIYQELGGSMITFPNTIGWIPDFNLRYIYSYEFNDWEMSNDDS